MKFKSFVVSVLAVCGSLTVQAIPMLDVQINQVNDDVTLNWSVMDPGQYNQGIAFYVTAFDPFSHQVTGVFLGWWNATTGSLGGNIAQGWTNYSLYSVDDQDCILGSSGHWGSIFSEGSHDVFACFFGEDSTLPWGYSPDGQYGGNGTWLESSYTISSPSGLVTRVSDSGSTAVMLTLGCLVAGLGKWRKARKFLPSA